MAAIGYGYGSEWQLLQILGRRRGAFTKLVERATGCEGLVWRDHQECTDEVAGHLTLREAKGLEFLPTTDPVRKEWEGLWPQSGNVHNWDAVAVSASGTWLLLEAKAHLGELTSHCTAKAPDSVARIREVLNQTRREVGAEASADWATGYYQYCNRVALLHFLVKRGVDARLVFVYFTGDRSDLGTAGRECPVDEGAWAVALGRQDRHAGLPAAAAIRERIHRLFQPAYWSNVAMRTLKAEFARFG